MTLTLLKIDRYLVSLSVCFKHTRYWYGYGSRNISGIGMLYLYNICFLAELDTGKISPIGCLITFPFNSWTKFPTREMLTLNIQGRQQFPQSRTKFPWEKLSREMLSCNRTGFPTTSGKGYKIYLYDKKSYSKIFRKGKVDAVRALTLVLKF